MPNELKVEYLSDDELRAAACRAVGDSLYAQVRFLLDMTEIESGILNRQWLNRRLGNAATLQREVAGWKSDRNRRSSMVNWRLTTTDARVKLRRLNPSIL
jgi:hypothetical protein